MAMAKVLNQERFLPPRLPGLSLWLDAQDITTISSSTAGVSSWTDKSGMGNTMNSTTFSVPGCTLWLDAADSTTVTTATGSTTVTGWADKSGLGNNATGASATTTTQYTTPLNTATTVTIPASSTVKVTVIGGGGGGGGNGGFYGGGGNGGVGGNGAVATYTFAASSVTTMTYYVGGGGNGGAYVSAFAQVGGNGGGGGQNSYVTIGTTTIYAGGGGGGGGGGGTTFSGQGGSAGIGSGGGSGGVGGAVAVYAAGGVGNPGSIINGSTGTRVTTYGNGGSGGSAGGGVGGVSGNNGLVIIEITPPPPTINSTGLNGYPTMNFNGTQWFTGPIVNTTSNLTVFAVVMLAGNAVYNSRIVSLATPTKVDYNTYTEVLALQQGYTNTWIATGRNTQPPTGGTFNFVAAIDYSTTSNVPYIAGALYNGTSSTQSLVVNGSVKSTNATTGAFGYTSYGIGNYSAAPGASEPFTGKISEILIFNTALTTFQRQQIEIYLSKKWQIPLSYSLPTTPLLFSPTSSSIPAISNTLTNQPSIFFPPGGQMGSILNSDLGAPTIPGCQLWLDAADTTTLTRSGSSVIEWRDKSGNGYNMNNTIGTFPVTGAAINGLNTVRFAAGSSIKQSTVVNGAKNFYWVGKIASANLDGYFFFLLGADYAYEWHANVIGAGNTYLYPYSANSPWVSLGIYNATASQYGGGSSAATNVAFSSLKYPPDGSLTMISATGITGNTYYQGLCYDRGDSTRGWRGDLAEVIIFNQPLTTAQHQQVEGYLATKWGLRANLPPTHPYFSLPYSGTFTLNPSTPVSKSLFMAYQCPQTSSSMRFAVGMDVSGLAFGLAQSNGTVYAPYQYGYGDTKWTVTPNTYIVPTVTSAIFDAGATMIRGDHAFNSFLDVRESALVNTIPNSPYILGAAPTAFSSVFISASFHVCEIIAYNRALGTTDRQMIEGYLAWKWGMTTQLPNGHPYQKFPPTGEQVVVASTPSNLYSGLVSWLDMADSTTYTLSGNTANLKTLTDKAGGGAFTISGNVSISTLGSLPSLSFTGNNSATVQSGGFLFKTLTVPPRGCAFAVFTPSLTQVAAEKLGVLGWGSPGNNSNNPALGYTKQSSTILRSYNPIDQTTSRFYGPSMSLAVSKPAIVFWAWYNGNMVYLASNGNTVLSSPQTAGLFNAASTNNIFYIGNDGGFGANFNLGELCVYNDYLETPFRNILEGYLAWKWGIQANLPSFHPYALSAPTLQTLTEVNALSQPTDISGLTMWLDAGDTATIQQVNPTVTFTGSPTLLGVSNGYTYYAFKGNGSITSANPLEVQYFAVGGGGGGGFDYGAGGGAGGLQTNTSVYAYPSQVSTITALVPNAVYSITIGTGGAYESSGAAPNQGSPGGNTTFTGTGISVTASGGGGGGQGNSGSGGGGGCGGGGGYPYQTATPGGTGTQGGNGITGVISYWGGAGGGIGGNATSGGPTPLNGGPGLQFFGTFYGGGGGGAACSGTVVGSGGSGVGGTGGYGNYNLSTGFVQGIPPVSNSGGGGAGGGGYAPGTAGAAGIFIVGIPVTQTAWLDKSAISNNLVGTLLTSSNFGPPARPSVYFGPGTSATSTYNSGADSKQFSAFLVASIPTLSYLLVSTGQLTTGTTGLAGQTFGFFASNGLASVLSPLVVFGTGATNNEVGNYSAISGTTFELFASICGTAVSGNMNFATPLSSVNNTANAITSTPWVFGNCTGDTFAKSFHVHEFITYNRPITTLERQMIEGYLYWKWMV